MYTKELYICFQYHFERTPFPIRCSITSYKLFFFSVSLLKFFVLILLLFYKTMMAELTPLKI